MSPQSSRKRCPNPSRRNARIRNGVPPRETSTLIIAAQRTVFIRRTPPARAPNAPTPPPAHGVPRRAPCRALRARKAVGRALQRNAGRARSGGGGEGVRHHVLARHPQSDGDSLVSDEQRERRARVVVQRDSLRAHIG